MTNQPQPSVSRRDWSPIFRMCSSSWSSHGQSSRHRATVLHSLRRGLVHEAQCRIILSPATRALRIAGCAMRIWPLLQMGHVQCNLEAPSDRGQELKFNVSESRGSSGQASTHAGADYGLRGRLNLLRTKCRPFFFKKNDSPLEPRRLLPPPRAARPGRPTTS